MADVEPFGGEKALERAVEEGKDPNADLNEVDKSVTKAQAAVTLRLAGTGYTQIAKTLGYSSATRARSAVERALAASSDKAEDHSHMRELTDRRLNRLLQSVMGKAVDPKDPEHLSYNARALAIIDRQAKLHGVDAPTKVQVTPTDQDIMRYIEAVHPLARAHAELEEADILSEGEMVERTDRNFNDG